MVAGADCLLALRGHPFEAAQRVAHLVGLGRLRFLDRRLVGVDHAVGVGAVEVGLDFVGGLEGVDELLVLGRFDLWRIAGAGHEAFGRVADSAEILRCDGAGSTDQGHIAGEPELLQLGEQSHRVVARHRGVEHLRACGADLAEILRVVLRVERGEHLADGTGTDLLGARLEGGHGGAAHLIVGSEIEHLRLRLLLGEPDGERCRLLAGAGIHAEDVGRAAIAGDGIGERHRRGHQLAGALGSLANRERRAGADGAGEEVDLGDLEQLFRLLHRDGGIGLLVLVDELDRAPHDAAGGIHFLGGEIEAPAHLLADAGVGAAERGHHPDLDGIGRLRSREARCRQQGGKHGRSIRGHDIPPWFGRNDTTAAKPASTRGGERG